MEILGIGPMELLLILIIALMVFGPDKLPEIGAKLGQSLRSVRRATHEFSREIEETRQAIEAPLSELKQPLNEITQPLNDLKQPFQELKQPLDDLRHPLREMSQAAQELPGQARQALSLAAGTVESATAAAGDNGTGALPTATETGTATADSAAGSRQDPEPIPGTTPSCEAIDSSKPEEEPAGADPETAVLTSGMQAEVVQEPAPASPGEQPADPASIATDVINPQEALRQVIARQMRMGSEGQP